jgi:UDP-3-O-[3-hydroxymyristoyl] glucosamine N-acyltransferase
MTEPLFAPEPSPISIAEIAALTGALPQGEAQTGFLIAGVAPLERAGPRDLVFVDNSKFLPQLATTRAGACLITERLEADAPPHVVLLRTKEPYRAFVTVARKLFATTLRPTTTFGVSGIASGAIVHPAARLESGVTVDPGAVIGPQAEIGSGTVIGAGAVIGPAVRIGRDSSIGAGASITHTIIGDRVIVHPGCRIGQDGFGYIMGAGGHLKVPQIRRVIIQDDVEIGAGTCVDRGAFRDTVIGEGTKIDNMVQIAHNVSIGRHCVIVAQCGIAGSAILEDFVVLGGCTSVIDHAVIGEGAQLAARSGVHTDVPAGARWGGAPVRPLKQWFREIVTLERLARAESVKEPSESGNRSKS